jgi:hypothetical protein
MKPPLGFALVVVPVVALLVLHLLGARAYLGILSGTSFTTGEALLAVSYALAWFGVVVTVPILVLARLLMAAPTLVTWMRACRSSRAR